MATALGISLDEYLDTSYRPDREYIDGELRERNVGKREHARVQWLLANWFGQHEKEWGITGYTEWRAQVAPMRVRIPDVIVVASGPQPDVLAEAPLLVIEILSPDDTYADIEERAQDYFRMGCGMVWIIDPKTRSGRMCTETNWQAAERLEVPGTPLYVNLAELFAGIQPTA